MKNIFSKVVTIICTVVAGTLTVNCFNKAADTSDKKKKLVTYAVAVAGAITTLISAKCVADEFLLPEDDTVPGSLEDISEEKDFVDPDIASED